MAMRENCAAHTMGLAMAMQCARDRWDGLARRAAARYVAAMMAQIPMPDGHAARPATGRRVGAAVLLAMAGLLIRSGPGAAQLSVTRFGASAARACYEAALSLHADDPAECDRALSEEALSARDRRATLVNRGIILNRAGRYAEAVADFDAALKSRPGLPEASLNRGNARFFQKDYDGALADYRAALANGLRTPAVAWYNIGLALEATGDRAGAAAAYDEALRLDPGLASAARKREALRADETP